MIYPIKMFIKENIRFIQIILSFVVGVLLFGFGVQLYPTTVDPVGAACSPSSSSVSSSDRGFVPNSSLAQTLISWGEKSLVKEVPPKDPEYFTTEKEKGLDDFSKRDYDGAFTHFGNALKNYANAPETRIYLNNAQISKSKSLSRSIAVVVPTGDDPSTASEILRGVAQAQDEINSSVGIKGVPLKVVIANDNDNDFYARQIATYLVKNLEVKNLDLLGVVGHSASNTSLAVKSDYETGKLVAISPTSTAVDLSNSSHYFFRTAPSDHDTAEHLAKYMLTKLQREKAAIFFSCDSTYSISLRKQFYNAVLSQGGSVLDTTFDLSARSFNAALSVEQAIKQGAQVLMLAPDPYTLDKALEVVDTNKKQLSLLGGDNVSGCKILNQGNAAEGMIVPVPWVIDKHKESKFVKDSQILWQAPVNWRTALAYDATKALRAAIERSPERRDIRKNLLSNGFSSEDESGSIKFLPSGDRLNPPVELVKISTISHKGPCDSNYGFVPVPEFK